MQEIKSIAENIEIWKANKDMHECDGHKEHFNFSKGVIYGLELAREYNNRPLNQAIATDSLKPSLIEGVAYTMEYVDAETVVFTRCR